MHFLKSLVKLYLIFKNSILHNRHSWTHRKGESVFVCEPVWEKKRWTATSVLVLRTSRRLVANVWLIQTTTGSTLVRRSDRNAGFGAARLTQRLSLQTLCGWKRRPCTSAGGPELRLRFSAQSQSCRVCALVYNGSPRPAAGTWRSGHGGAPAAHEWLRSHWSPTLVPRGYSCGTSTARLSGVSTCAGRCRYGWCRPNRSGPGSPQCRPASTGWG